MKTYTLRIDLKIDANSDDEAKRQSLFFIKELPRLEKATVSKASMYSHSEKKIICEDVR